MPLWLHEQIEREAQKQGLAFNTQEERMNARGHLIDAIRNISPGDLAASRKRLSSLFGDRSLCIDSARNHVVPALAATWPFLAGWPGAIEQHVAEKLNVGGREKGGSIRNYHREQCYALFGGRMVAEMTQALLHSRIAGKQVSHVVDVDSI